MFEDLICFDNWDEDELSLLSNPCDLENFFKENSALHSVFLCRHYFDYLEFKENNTLTQRIDAIIIDIRLDNNVNFDLPIPIDSQEKEKFHINAGFYIFNDLVILVKKSMLFIAKIPAIQMLKTMTLKIFYCTISGLIKNRI